ncbi:hypothetical protein E5A73_16720 [Sphingomonas gei]|uniref:Arginase n=1 Tax=Sphingomonas gei TaxID=1395960 RepID=A0A4S1XAZ3_9SPHN|nr:arginase family protein [Sphingomonas gei]TGX52430.1 hypothetical protein E5A73_16720 [Sphingomonas gei]
MAILEAFCDEAPASGGEYPAGDARHSGPQGDPAGADPLLTTRLMVSDDLALESQDDTHIVVINTASSARTKLSLSAYRLLKAFARPCRIDQVAPAQVAAQILPQVRMLVDKQMLVDADAPVPADTVRLRTAVAYKFCGAPAYAKSKIPDFVILGVPYDLAGETDSRLAPALIRRKSLDYSYQLDFGDGRPRGWFDVNRGVWMLRGATLADAGDVPVDYGENRACWVERVGTALAECCTGHSVPLILGGDRSVTGAALGGLRHPGKLTVVQITADPEHAADGAGRHLLRMDKVERVVSLGACLDRRPETVRAWGDALSIYLSIDPSIAGARWTAPPGPTLHELKVLIAAIGKVHRIVGIELVGLDMRSRSPELAAITGCHLALAAMSAAHDRF